MKQYLEKIIEKENLSFDEAFNVMNEVMTGNVSHPLLAGFLVALKAKGETPAEVAGFAKAMRENCIRIDCDDENAIDVCGTGGDNSGSFNISTAVAFTAAGAGVKVAKHGNRSISSKSGSADVLQNLGVNINLRRDESERALKEIGIAFLFAPLYHPAMKHATPVRKELAMKTVFNMLGPLTNPAGVKKQLIGTFTRKAAKTMAEAAEYLDFEKACFVCSNDSYDEIYLGDITEIHEYNKSKEVITYTITNDSFNYPRISEEDIKGDSAEINAKIILDVFQNKNLNGAYHTIAANSALALYCSGFSDNLNECQKAAEASILSGAAFAKLNELKKFSNQFN